MQERDKEMRELRANLKRLNTATSMAVWVFSALTCSSTLLPQQAEAGEIVVYSARKEHLVKPLFEAFEAENPNIKVVYRTDKAGALVEKLKAEGKRSPADILFTVDAGNLWFAAQQNLMQEVSSSTLESNIPKHLQDPQNRWFAFSIRARTIVYNPKLVKKEDLSTYEDLASSKWQGKLCLRTSKKVYNQSLVAMMIDALGEEKAMTTVQGWVKNLSSKVFSNDTNLLKAMHAGKCHVGIVNTYYLGRLLKKKPETSVKIFWPNQNSFGTHINISGAGLLKSSKNPIESIKLLEWLSEAKAQAMLASMNMEFPVKAGIPMDPVVKAWGPFKGSEQNIAIAGKLQTKAVRLMDKAGYK